MLRTRRVTRSVCWTAGLLLSTAGVGVLAPAAVADVTDGALRIVVNRDVDADGVYDAAVDAPQAGIEVAVSDAVGTTVSGVTDAAGEFTVPASEKLLGGRYFVVAQVPATLPELTPVPETASFTSLSTTVDLTAGDQLVRMGVAVRAVEPSTEAAPEPAPEPEPVPQIRAAPQVQPPAPAPVDPPSTSVTREEPPRFAVGDHVFSDLDRSGQQDGGEPPTPRISVQLLDGRGEVLASTVSSASGRYVFDRLPAGTYSVRFAGVPGGYKLTGSGRGGDRALDSDPDYTGVTPPFTLGAAEANVRPTTPADGVSADFINPAVDAGITGLRYAVGEQVWLDTNRDGLRQPEEPASRATVTLLTDQRDVVATTATDAQGRYRFTGLRSGRYRLKFTGLPPHRAFTTPRAGRDADVDSDPDPRTGLTPVFRLDPNAPGLVPAADVGIEDADFVDAGLNAGLVGVYSVGDTVWRDHDGDGLLGEGDVGVAGVRVQLLGPNGQVLGVKTTSAYGRFTFAGLPAGRYRLKFLDLPRGLVFAASGAGTNPAVDSDAGILGVTSVVTVGEDNPVDTTLDAGLATPADVRAAAVLPGLPVPADTTLSSTGGVAWPIPVGAAALVLGGLGCLVLGRRRRGRASGGLR